MKKYPIFINVFLLCLFSLIACTNNNENVKEQENVKSEINDNNSSEENRKSTSNPLELMRDDSYEIFEHGSSELEVIGRYVSEESDSDGVVELEKNGYKVDFALILVHSPVVDENSIYVLGEHQNMNKDGGRMGIPESVIKTNEQEELRDEFTTGTLEPDSKATITNKIFLDDDELVSFEIIFKEPSESESNNEESNASDWKVLKFQKSDD